MITDNQLPKRFLNIIKEQLRLYGEPTSIQVVNEIPDTTQIPIENQSDWIRIPRIICVYVDMAGSTKLSAELHDKSTAKTYQLFTGTAVRLFNEFDSPYIDVKGDGVFALFNENQTYTALAAAVTFKTFVRNVFIKKILDKTRLEVGLHTGIDKSTVLVKKIGLKKRGGRTDKQNEVWAGKPVNMAAKLAKLSDNNNILVSDRYFQGINDEHALYTCGCTSGTFTGEKVNMWEEVDLSEVDNFDFSTAYSLPNYWCETHGQEFCEALLSLDT